MKKTEKGKGMKTPQRHTKKRANTASTSSNNIDSMEPPPQFDSSDLGSPKKVWSVLCEKDETYKRESDLFLRQRKLNTKMRSMLIDWIMDVCADKHLHRETFHLCIDYIDRYIGLMDEDSVPPQRLQLIGSTALVIAAKIEEIYPPKTIEIAEYTDGCCTEEDLRNMEEVMLQTLDWNFYPITAVHWLALYMQLMNTCDVLPARQVILSAEKRQTAADDQHNMTSNDTSFSFSASFYNVPSLLNVSIISANDETEKDENGEKMAKETNNENEQPRPATDFQTPKKSLVSVTRAEMRVSSSSCLSSGRRISFHSSYPQMQLSQIGSSPRVLLHTAVADISYVGNSSYSSGHIYPDQRCTVPKLMRGDFVRMAMILDLVILDAESLRFRYRELASAVLLCSYEPENLICRIIGLSSDKLREAREFVDPFVQLVDKLEPSGTTIPCVPNVPHSDRHNIQTYTQNCLKHLETVDEIRKDMERRRKALNIQVVGRIRKRKFSSPAALSSPDHCLV